MTKEEITDRCAEIFSGLSHDESANHNAAMRMSRLLADMKDSGSVTIKFVADVSELKQSIAIAAKSIADQLIQQ